MYRARAAVVLSDGASNFVCTVAEDDSVSVLCLRFTCLVRFVSAGLFLLLGLLMYCSRPVFGRGCTHWEDKPCQLLVAFTSA